MINAALGLLAFLLIAGLTTAWVEWECRRWRRK